MLPSVAAAQLDLPAKAGAKPMKNPADALVPATPRPGDAAPRDAAPLDLPRAGLPAAGTAQPDVRSAMPDPALEAGASPEQLARGLFRELAGARDPRLATPLIERLLALGPAVLSVARAELGGDHAATLLAAGRLCLLGGASDDRAAVAERLTRALPAEAALALFEELLARDPVLASPEYLAGLLAHPLAPLRTRAAQALEPHLSVATLAALAPVLASKNSAARAAALELVARVSDPLAWNLLASRLGDPSARLAQRAAALLASLDGAEALVLERAFPSELRPGPLQWDRQRGYALLALVVREETHARVLVDEAKIESLRGGLASSQPLVAGVCAVALARVGFRSPAARTGVWLDRDVPHQLVRAGTGAEFHADFSSLEGPALRALGLLSGEGFGPDGEAWRQWWLGHAGDFRARRAVIELPADAAAVLAVSFRDARERSWALLGPARVATLGKERVLRLSPAAAERLLARLEAEGVFANARLPDPVGAQAGGVLRVAIGEQEKSFADGPGRSTWIAALRVELEQAVRDNLWQLHPDPPATGAAEWWRSEHARFEAFAPLARQHELKHLLLAALRRTRGVARDEALAELEGLYRELGVPQALDFEPLLAVLASEAEFEPRGAVLCELARVAAGGQGGEPLEPAARERLIETVLEHFGPAADAALARVARDLEPAASRALAVDPRPRARALMAAGLARSGAEPERVRALLLDPDPDVRLATLAALAETPAEGLRPELLACARSAAGAERLGALRALVLLGGKEVQDLALETVGDPEPSVQAAGVAALAELADPGSASLFAALLARGPDSLLYAEARRGLLRLGPVGIEECLRLARSAGARARREAVLVLAEVLAPEAAEHLLELLGANPRDERMLWELAVLAGQDFAAEPDPLGAAAAWWELVVHDQPLAWLCAAAERVGVPAPPPSALAGPGSAEGARFLLALTELSAPALVERATRELERLLARPFPRPATNEERVLFRAELAEVVRARFGE